MYTNRRFNRRRQSSFVWLTLAILFVNACGLINRAPVQGDEVEFQPAAAVMLACTAACAERGQCGTGLDGTPYVLGGQAAPLVENHDRRFLSDSNVTILASSLQTIQSVIDGGLSELRFYHVQPQDESAAGWVAGWCVVAP